MPSPCRRPSKIPLSTSVKSITGCPAASCSRTISSPLTFQAAMSLVKGSAAAQPGSSSSFKPCGEASPFSVTTQVLLRSVVESSHWPIMSFFRAEASCDRAGDAKETGNASNASSAGSTMPGRPADHQRPFTGVSATGVSGGLPANQALRLSTTS